MCASDSWRNAFSESSYLSLRCGVRNEPGVRAVGKEMFGDGDMAAAVIDRIVHHGRTSGSIASRTTTVMFW